MQQDVLILKTSRTARARDFSYAVSTFIEISQKQFFWCIGKDQKSLKLVHKLHGLNLPGGETLYPQLPLP